MALLLTEQAQPSGLLTAVQVLLVLGVGLAGLLVSRRLTTRMRGAHQEMESAIERGAAAEDALQRREAFLSTLIDVLGVEVVAIDPDGRSLLWNEASRRAYSVPSTEQAGAPVDWVERFSLLDSDGSPLRADRLPLHRALAGDTVEAAEVSVAAAGLPVRHLIVHARPIRLPSGELLGAVTAGHDVSVLRAREAELQRLNSDLDAIAHAKDAVLHGSDAGAATCQAALSITGALSAMLLEVQGDRLVMIRCAGLVMPSIDVPAGGGSLAAVALRTGKVQLSADVRSQAEVNQCGVAQFDQVTGGPHLQAVVHVPLVQAARTRGVLTVALPSRIGAGDLRLLGLLELLAADAVQAMTREDLLQQLATQALTDPLTGLRNRRAWEQDLAREVARSTRTGSSLSVAVLDLDHFKAYNDEHGHPAGDWLLSELAKVWSGRLRAGDVLARLGGEEFAVLLVDCDRTAAADLVNRLLRELPRGCTCSAGIAQAHPDSPGQAEDLMSRADQALYEAKRGGRARLMIAPQLDAPRPRHRQPPARSASRC